MMGTTKELVITWLESGMGYSALRIGGLGTGASMLTCPLGTCGTSRDLFRGLPGLFKEPMSTGDQVALLSNVVF